MSPPLPKGRVAVHENGCTCARCVGLEVCPLCGRQKLDIDWCFECERLLFISPPCHTRFAAGAAPAPDWTPQEEEAFEQLARTGGTQ